MNRATVVVMPQNFGQSDPKFTQAFEALGIRSNEALVLRYIAQNPGKTHRKIADGLGISSTTVRRICEHYAKDEIIVNFDSPNSRKYHLSVPALLRAAENYLGQIVPARTDKKAPGQSPDDL